MCQLLGMNANTPTDVMFSFTGLATRAAEHKDGFGIAFFEDRGLRHFIDRESALHSPVAEMVKRYPIKRDVVNARREDWQRDPYVSGAVNLYSGEDILIFDHGRSLTFSRSECSATNSTIPTTADFRARMDHSERYILHSRYRR